MNDWPRFRRRNYFINKKFQIDFAVKFLIIIIVAVIAVLGLFLYDMRGTITVGYRGAMVDLDHSAQFFFPSLLISTVAIIIIMGIVAVLLLIFISHRISGPFFRFEKTLCEIKDGNLTLQFSIRKHDQFKNLANHVNVLVADMDGKVGHMKSQVDEIISLISELKSNPSYNPDLEPLLMEFTKRLLELQAAANYFKTSPLQKS